MLKIGGKKWAFGHKTLKNPQKWPKTAYFLDTS
jgi:hypothetical protein